MGIGLKRHIKRGARIIHSAPDQSLHGHVAAAGVNEPDIKTFLRKMSTRPSDLIGNDAEELPAKSQ